MDIDKDWAAKAVLMMVNGGQRNLGMAMGAGLLWLADSMLQVAIGFIWKCRSGSDITFDSPQADIRREHKCQHSDGSGWGA